MYVCINGICLFSPENFIFKENVMNFINNHLMKEVILLSYLIFITNYF